MGFKKIQKKKEKRHGVKSRKCLVVYYEELVSLKVRGP